MIYTENMEIRKEVVKSGVKMWEVAEAMGIADTTFSRKLRRELPHEQQEHILTVIREIAGRKGELSDANNEND